MSRGTQKPYAPLSQAIGCENGHSSIYYVRFWDYFILYRSLLVPIQFETFNCVSVLDKSKWAWLCALLHGIGAGKGDQLGIMVD